MLSRDARAERQTNLRRLHSLRVEREEKCKELRDKYAALPELPAAHCLEAVLRILEMSEEALFKWYEDYKLRRYGKGPVYNHAPPRDTRNDDDPEMAEAVERLNVASRGYDAALLELRIAELFGGRVSCGSERLSKVWLTRTVLGILRSVKKGEQPSYVRLH